MLHDSLDRGETGLTLPTAVRSPIIGDIHLVRVGPLVGKTAEPQRGSSLVGGSMGSSQALAGDQLIRVQSSFLGD